MKIIATRSSTQSTMRLASAIQKRCSGLRLLIPASGKSSALAECEQSLMLVGALVNSRTIPLNNDFNHAVRYARMSTLRVAIANFFLIEKTTDFESYWARFEKPAPPERMSLFEQPHGWGFHIFALAAYLLDKGVVSAAEFWDYREDRQSGYHANGVLRVSFFNLKDLTLPGPVRLSRPIYQLWAEWASGAQASRRESSFRMCPVCGAGSTQSEIWTQSATS